MMLRAVYIVLPLLALVAPSGAAPRDYTGAAACGTCHTEAYTAWQKTAHAIASSVDVLGSRARDGACLACHATGDGANARARLPGVQCEACHGGGVAYSPDDVMRDRPLALRLGLRDLGKDPAAVCARCHRDPTSPATFDYAAAWRKIAH